MSERYDRLVNLETEALTWALCAAAGGGGPGKCDPNTCACGGDARAAVVALHLTGHKIIKVTHTTRKPFQFEFDDEPPVAPEPHSK